MDDDWARRPAARPNRAEAPLGHRLPGALDARSRDTAPTITSSLRQPANLHGDGLNTGVPHVHLERHRTGRIGRPRLFRQQPAQGPRRSLRRCAVIHDRRPSPSRPISASSTAAGGAARSRRIRSPPSPPRISSGPGARMSAAPSASSPARPGPRRPGGPRRTTGPTCWRSSTTWRARPIRASSSTRAAGSASSGSRISRAATGSRPPPSQPPTSCGSATATSSLRTRRP